MKTSLKARNGQLRLSTPSYDAVSNGAHRDGPSRMVKLLKERLRNVKVVGVARNLWNEQVCAFILQQSLAE